VGECSSAAAIASRARKVGSARLLFWIRGRRGLLTAILRCWRKTTAGGADVGGLWLRVMAGLGTGVGKEKRR